MLLAFRSVAHPLLPMLHRMLLPPHPSSSSLESPSKILSLRYSIIGYASGRMLCKKPGNEVAYGRCAYTCDKPYTYTQIPRNTFKSTLMHNIYMSIHTYEVGCKYVTNIHANSRRNLKTNGRCCCFEQLSVYLLTPRQIRAERRFFCESYFRYRRTYLCNAFIKMPRREQYEVGQRANVATE